MNQDMKNNLKIIASLLVVFIILYALHVTFGDRFEDQYGGQSCLGPTNIIFTADNVSKTLTVSEIYSNDRTIHWSEISIIGTANELYGPINVGDVITGCEGYIEIVWAETGNVIYSTNFEIEDET